MLNSPRGQTRAKKPAQETAPETVVSARCPHPRTAMAHTRRQPLRRVRPGPGPAARNFLVVKTLAEATEEQRDTGHLCGRGGVREPAAKHRLQHCTALSLRAALFIKPRRGPGLAEVLSLDDDCQPSAHLWPSPPPQQSPGAAPVRTLSGHCGCELFGHIHLQPTARCPQTSAPKAPGSSVTR